MAQAGERGMAVLDWRAGGVACARAFLLEHSPAGKLALVFHGDTDGCTAAVILVETLAAGGAPEPLLLPPGKGENCFTPGFRERLEARQPASLVVLDMGSRPQPILPRPILVLDHHAVEGTPPGAVLVTSYRTLGFSTPTAELARVVAEGLPGYQAERAQWLAALGVQADAGAAAPVPALAAAKARYGTRILGQAAALVNAPRRSAGFKVMAAVAALQAADSPTQIAELALPEAKQLEVYRQEVEGELRRARRAAPLFAGRVALLKFSSPCQVHGMVAASWARRLAGYVVMAANVGYLPGKVSFAVRAYEHVDLLHLLRGLEFERAEPDEYAHGHRAATGGSLACASFNRMLAALGFGPEAMVPEQP